jgi:hypothetical protein
MSEHPAACWHRIPSPVSIALVGDVTLVVSIPSSLLWFEYKTSPKAQILKVWSPAGSTFRKVIGSWGLWPLYKHKSHVWDLFITIIYSCTKALLQCECLCVLQFVCWNSNSQDDSFSRWGLLRGRWVGLALFCPFYHVRTHQEATIFESGNRPLSDTESSVSGF